MKPILTIFKKEFKDITRDRRSMIMMFIIPMPDIEQLKKRKKRITLL